MVGIDDLFDNSKSETGAFFIFSTGKVRLIEAIPYFSNAVPWDSDTGILDRDKHFIIFNSSLNGDRGIMMTEFDRIVNEIVQYLLDAGHIRHNKQGIAGQHETEGNLFFLAHLFKGFHRHANAVIQVKGRDIEKISFGAIFVQIQQLLGQFFQTFCLKNDDI